MNMQATAKAHTNIALIKYWGKQHESLILAMNNSLSITLDGLYTETAVTFDEQLTTDKFYLNEQLISGTAYDRVTTFLDLIRQLAGKQIYATVESTNKVPTAVGFASSASGFAALAAAGARAMN